MIAAPDILAAEFPARYRPGVLVLVNSLRIGGAEKHAIALTNHLDRNQFRAGLCALKSGGTLASELDTNGLGPLLLLDVRRKLDWSAALRLARYIDRHQIDILVCTNGYPLLYAIPASWLAKRPVRLVEVFHTTGVRSAIASRLRAVFNRFAFRRCELLVYVSQLQREFWHDRWLRARRDIVIHNGVDTEHFTDRYTAAQKAAVRAEYGFAANDYVVGICASLRPEKAHLDLLESVRRLHDAGVNIRLLIIGDGAERARIEAKIADRQLQHIVAITGYQSDVRPLIAACDVMTLTSHTIETFSIAALESMSLGKPLILSRVGGAAEQVIPGQTGFLFAPGDIDTLTEHLRTLSNIALAHQLGATAAKVVRERFTTHRMVTAFARELRALASQPPSRDTPHGTAFFETQGEALETSDRHRQ
jgi:glycosyltransferase involved in cell wall biosynthesis